MTGPLKWRTDGQGNRVCQAARASYAGPRTSLVSYIVTILRHLIYFVNYLIKHGPLSLNYSIKQNYGRILVNTHFGKNGTLDISM